jgi:NAD(P)H-flavin reductase
LAKIIKKIELASSIKLMELEAKEVSAHAKAGQFVILIIDEKGERIPLTIADYNKEKGTITIVFQEVGKTTLELGKFSEGDNILHLNGPLGKASEIINFGNVIIIGGGVGIAPIHPIARSLKEAGNKITTIIGSRTKDLLFWEDKMKSVSHNLIVTTDDGSYGVHGFVTDPLKQIIEKEKVDRVIAIGPIPMMKAVSKVTKENGIPTVVSLNSLMVCGMGMCGACRVKVSNETKFTCFEGPEFDGNNVDFVELSERLSTYKCEEKTATTHYEEELNASK